jgi:hypothetical protein
MSAFLDFEVSFLFEIEQDLRSVNFELPFIKLDLLLKIDLDLLLLDYFFDFLLDLLDTFFL